jgi:hypothetical protein
MTEHAAAVHLRPNGEYLFEVSSLTINGFWISDGTPVVLAKGASVEQIGTAAREALQRSRQGIPAYDHRTQDPSRPLLDLVGLPTYARYARGVRMVDVSRNFDEGVHSIELTPQNNGGARSGFTPIGEHRLKVTYESPAQLGRAVLDVLQFATA